MGIYIFIGKDATSAFIGKGKIGPMKKLNANPKSLGEWAVFDDISSNIEAFTCLKFGYSREKRINAVRAKILRKMVGEDNQLTIKSKINLSRLRPAEDNLKPHIYCVNHRVATYNRASEPIYWTPKPWEESQGWVKNVNGVMEPMWSLRPVLPQSFMDILETTSDDFGERNEENETDEDKEMDSEEMFDEDLDI